ncbi:DUF3006 domain-containing protein [Rubrobacter taiwanensis]|jgi:hypothetical protein|uniref:DUF3006 domain-containing protein n=1 Tax=Rubrobacter taiwanensis TaxID=185139 RepID=A0A4R1BP81_9ACTN|nr:DUF3006 domain-containing protein [Rubrobacter taiwanensis]TCJ19399.1 DUF3006 domain-containing protein [Rubrobacter taiwanensis]
MRVQLDHFEDNGWAVMILGRTTFDVPRDLLPADARPGDVFDVEFRKDERETGRLREENRRLLDELLRGGAEET